MKKMLAMLLAAVMILGLFAGCGNKAPAADAPSADAPAQSGDAPAAVNKLVIGIQSYSTITDYQDNYLTNLLAEKLGCEIEVMQLPADLAELQTKIALMATTPEELPDVIFSGDLPYEMVVEYGNNGVFLDVSSYMDDPASMPNFNAIPEEHRNMIKNGALADGKVYAISKFSGDAWSQTPYRLYINEAWLNAVGMNMPTTTEELHAVLKAFATQDPNGNGKKDEIPLYGSTNSGVWGGNLFTALMNAFLYYNPETSNGLALDATGTNVVAPFTDEAFKEGLLYMKRLYDDGLIPDAVFTDDPAQFKATVNNEEVNLVGAVVIGSYGNWNDAANNPNFNELTLAAPIAGPEGVAYTPWNSYTIQRTFVITSNCKNVDLAVKMADLFFDESIGYTTRFGEEGVDWTKDPEVTALYTSNNVEAGLSESVDLVIYNDIWAEQTNKFWHAFTPYYYPPDFNYADQSLLKETFAAEGGALKTNQARIKSLGTYFVACPEYIIPTLNYNDDEFSVVGEVSMYVTDYVNQSIAQFVTGERDIEKEWDSYLAELDNMGLQDWIAMAQAAYERTK